MKRPGGLARGGLARAALCLALGFGCACNAGVPQRSTVTPPGEPDGGAEPAGEPYVWQPATRSPQPPEPAGDDLARACERHDRALDRVAALVARRELSGPRSLDVDEITEALRAEGGPYVWPHVWTLSGRHAPDAGERFLAWRATMPRVNEERCGTARMEAREREVSVGLVVDVLADLEPLPTSAAIGAWLDVKAELLVPTSAVEVLVLGPHGHSFAVPSSLEGGRVRARFHADRAGAWLVQLLATVAGGPRPVAEALVFAGRAPSTLAASSPAPGEVTATGADPADALFTMVSGARASEHLAELRRDGRLDRIARAHAEAMRTVRRLAHDADDGSPGDRVLSAGVRVAAVGENVAHAADAAHAHRTLWRSPSHRANLLETSYDAVGIGVALDTDSTVWVCEVFAALAQ